MIGIGKTAGRPSTRAPGRDTGRACGRFGACESGSLFVIMAVMLPIILVISASTLDFIMALRQKASLQAAADTAAIAGAKGLSLSDARRENVDSVVKAIVMKMIETNHSGEKDSASISVRAHVRSDPLEVNVVVRQDLRPSFSGRFGLAEDQIVVRSTARVVGTPNICVLALDPTANGAISLEKDAAVVGRDCAVFSNSTHSNAIKAKNSARLEASLICSAGGKDGGPGHFVPEPLTDCPTFEDPLAARPAPHVGSCITPPIETVVTSGYLAPGTYCGGLSIEGAIDVVMSPGIYVFKDGPLLVDDQVRLTGQGVGLHFVGDGAALKLGRATSISLEAPTSGEMAGLLIHASRNQPAATRFAILSDDARTLLGTIYVPNGEVYIDANKPIADLSAYTAIVARKITMLGGPKLVLNANYDLTDVPVPQGIRGSGQPISLVK